MEIAEVNSKKTWDQFLQLPFGIFKNDPKWVPPLLSEQKHLFDKHKNPFFKHCIYKAWLVLENDKPVGRVVAFIDTLYNNINNTDTGFLGFFDCIDQQEAADHLFDVSGQWLKQNGMNTICGPMNFSIGNECGVQLTGFEFPPLIQMNYTPENYRSLFENAGFLKEHDLYAYRMTADEVKDQYKVLSRLEKLAEHSLQKRGVKLRAIDFKNYKKELGHILSLYNDCMRSNWGFVPSSFEEMLYTSSSLKQIADKELIFFAEVNCEVVGCSVAVPDINQALYHVRNGKLFPLGFIKLLYHLKKINAFRLLFLGVRPDHRLKGLDSLFYYHTIRKGLERGYKMAELSWISEENKNLVSIVEKMGAERYKTYRMYKKKL